MKVSFDYKKIVGESMKNRAGIQLQGDMLLALQNCLYDMAVDIDNVCRKHGIQLFLVGGSLLGAVRHGGFIPWDDDIDLAASREDYEKLKGIFAAELSDRYDLRCPNSDYPTAYRFMQIFKKGTVLKTPLHANPYQPESVWIDIFPLDYVPENAIVRKIKGTYINLLMLIASCVLDVKNGGYKEMMQTAEGGKLYLRLRQMMGTLCSFFGSQKWFDIADRAVRSKKQTTLATLAFGRKHYFGEICPANTFLPCSEIIFGGGLNQKKKKHFFYAPANSDSYLRNMYGNDYMTPPPESERESHFVEELKV